ncbi:threonine--tRNA ligase [Vulcanibacillus modesticaldus]|uniref:Threonine--tRNA ligase n=1 Tax=Vulcanibacillus modesticaldus TaxID=337097 RepID=A0A1D2YSV6_9BACI|nr:threonine--tRNA ligase [Vulcanibacillus modesticaldus]OEF98087.1 threonine--tRNA ligase [Vulcanibacillus modesticaldus]
MEKIKITFPDGTVKEFDKGTTTEDIAFSISPSLKKKAIAGKLNGKLIDLYLPIEEDGAIEIITLESEEGLEIYRHSSAHLLAHAVHRLYPGTKFGIGPVIQDGFYYDMDLPDSFSPEDLEKIEKEMKKIINENIPIRRKVLSRNEALKLFTNIGDQLKIELINELPEEAEISIYEQGDFFDLCRGPHVPSTGKIKAFKLLSVAGAYWRGDSSRQMLQRIYGTSFLKQAQLDEYLNFLEEAKKRDHRKLGKELELFSFSEEAPGMPFYHPNGMVIRNELENLWREEHKKAGYHEIKTPIMMNQRLWEQSGHWEHYHENMYFTKVDNINFAVKPMNCPGAMLTYKTKLHSYRDLPLRYGELGLVHRHEMSGALNGLLRVRNFTQDDAHLFVRPDQIEEEINKIIELIDKFYSLFGFSYHVELSTRPEKSMGSDELWDLATNALKNVLEKRGLPYVVNEGDGAFYGPKIDFHVSDVLKRTWQTGTIQLDFQMPEKFDLSYIGEDNQRHTPVVIHRVIYGSLERFMALLIEHYAGAFPTWLAPVQVKLLPIAEPHYEYARNVLKQMESVGIRVQLDDRNEKIGYKIREAQLQKVPYMLIIGDKEVENNQVAVRKRGKGDLGAKALDEVIEQIMTEIKNRTSNEQ